MHTDSGELTLKDAYLHFAPIGPNISWAKSIWNAAIPPSKSFMVWRLFHNRLPTDENLASRGFQLPSCFCNVPLLLGWHPQGHVTVAAVVIYIFNAIWSCRNLLRFEDIIPNLNSTISMISANVSLVGNYTSLTAGPSMTDFQILKFFNVTIHHSKAPKIIEVLWTPPLQGWLKCNTDGSSLGNPGLAASAGIFRNFKGENVGCFAMNIGIATAFYAELMAVILAIEGGASEMAAEGLSVQEQILTLSRCQV
ncbi:ribonuclease H protein [Trifolium medium]|uniref:Ribonuclease H protein n=1 Tax=Trifolium medium TaxID=97028 RepID=A0A392MY23_9FABA|nr:ribonuclease H protein [Trifolium medium]